MMLTLIAALCFFAGAVVTLLSSSYKNVVFWVMLGVGFYILAGVNFEVVTS